MKRICHKTIKKWNSKRELLRRCIKNLKLLLFYVNQIGQLKDQRLLKYELYTKETWFCFRTMKFCASFPFPILRKKCNSAFKVPPRSLDKRKREIFLGI